MTSGIDSLYSISLDHIYNWSLTDSVIYSSSLFISLHILHLSIFSHYFVTMVGEIFPTIPRNYTYMGKVKNKRYQKPSIKIQADELCTKIAIKSSMYIGTLSCSLILSYWNLSLIKCKTSTQFSIDFKYYHQ